jgi:hypothetical protein
MTRVKIYFHSGFEPPPAAPGTPREPYLDRWVIDLNGDGATSVPAPAKTTVAFVQTDGPVHIEVRPPQDVRNADDHSPTLDGSKAYIIGAGWQISVTELGAMGNRVAGSILSRAALVEPWTPEV